MTYASGCLKRDVQGLRQHYFSHRWLPSGKLEPLRSQDLDVASRVLHACHIAFEGLFGERLAAEELEATQLIAAALEEQRQSAGAGRGVQGFAKV